MRIFFHIFAKIDEIKEFKHPRFGGASIVLKNHLKTDLKKYFNTRNINSINPSYLYRSGKPNKIDQFWATKLGEIAVKLVANDLKESIILSIQKENADFKLKNIPLSRYSSINELHRFVNKIFYNQKEFQVTEFGKKYLNEIIREIPHNKLYGINQQN